MFKTILIYSAFVILWGLIQNDVLAKSRVGQTPPPSVPSEFSSNSALSQRNQQMSKVGQDLTRLYLAWKAKEDGISEKSMVDPPSGSSHLPIFNGYVVIDAVASGDPETLKSDLEALGLKNYSLFGRVVSGMIPISGIEEMSRLDSLNFARPASSQTLP